MLISKKYKATELTWQVKECCAKFRTGSTDDQQGGSTVFATPKIQHQRNRWAKSTQDIHDGVNQHEHTTIIDLRIDVANCRTVRKREVYERRPAFELPRGAEAGVLSLIVR